MTHPYASHSGAPPVQLLGEAVLIQGSAIVETRNMVRRGIREARRDGIAPSPTVAALMNALDSIAAQAMSRPRHHDVAPAYAGPQSEISTAEAAAILSLSPRQVQRIATSLDGRRTPSGTWVFDKAAVHQYAQLRQENRNG